MTTTHDVSPPPSLEEPEGPAHRHVPLVSGYIRERPLGPYAILGAAYAAFAVAGAASGVRRNGLPRLTVADGMLLAVGTFKLSRLVTKAKITSVIRAPFARFVEEGDGPEVNEAPRGDGLQRAVGELLTCPFCFTQWSATLLAVSWLHAPRATRAVSGLLTVVAAADVLHVAWCRLESAS